MEISDLQDEILCSKGLGAHGTELPKPRTDPPFALCTLVVPGILPQLWKLSSTACQGLGLSQAFLGPCSCVLTGFPSSCFPISINSAEGATIG